MDWREFERFEWADDAYMPRTGEGDTLASQMVVAVTKLVYKWFNDGDVFDNHYMIEGWCNDLSSYANWIDKHSDAGGILYGISDCYNASEYEQLLYHLCEYLLEPGYLAELAEKPRDGSVYDCDGVFSFEEQEEDEEDWY